MVFQTEASACEGSESRQGFAHWFGLETFRTYQSTDVSTAKAALKNVLRKPGMGANSKGIALVPQQSEQYALSAGRHTDPMCSKLGTLHVQYLCVSLILSKKTTRC